MVADNFNITVLYLVWLPYGIDHFKAFIESYCRHTASCNHQLVIVFNGLAIEHPNTPDEYTGYLESRGVTAGQYLYFQNGQDIEIYRQAAATIRTGYILFLNTYSMILADDWLKHYADNFDDHTGIISASGSWQSYYSSVYQKHPVKWEQAKGFLYNFRKYKLFIKTFFYWRFLFKPFPNPHIRTNAFMVKAQDFLEMKTGAVNTKFKAYQFENGRKSLTDFYRTKGLKVLVMDKFGNTFESPEWEKSATFWVRNQENLLVSDNQTRIYETATEEEKKQMTWLAWGTK